MATAAHGHVECLQILLGSTNCECLLDEQGTDNSCPALLFAARFNQAAIIDLIRSLDPSWKLDGINERGETPLFVACDNGSLQVRPLPGIFLCCILFFYFSLLSGITLERCICIKIAI
eukprot:m.182843 g.182843  ORF g.182843 m.182843 type:complete len:118 (-) comp25491_c0_seq6:243-596(-)